MNESFQTNSCDQGGIAPNAGGGFTLIELLVVVGMVGLFAALLLPARAGAKADIRRAQCQGNLKHLGTGFHLFEVDHDEMFPPADMYTTVLGQIAWDGYLHRYIGGGAATADLEQGKLDATVTPRAEFCPADARVMGTRPDVAWNPQGLIFGRRSFAMVGVGPAWRTQWQVSTVNRTYPLPRIALGVGIYWSDSSGGAPDWDAKSYKTAEVKDPSGTILLVEEPGAQNIVNDQWPCISLGPQSPTPGSMAEFYQIDTLAQSANYGADTCRFHGLRFNYLFHDGRVTALSTNQTIGTGTLSDPKGMWTVAPGD